MGARDPYRRVAGFYDRIIEPFQAGVRSVAVGLAEPRPGQRVLDVGCGTGTGLVPFVDAGCEAAGVDVSEAMLARARERIGDRADLHLTEGDRLPFDDDRFDLVMTSMVAHEVDVAHRDRFVAEMARVARPGGRLMFVDFRFGSLRGWKGPLMRRVSQMIERIGGHYGGYVSFRAAGGIPALLAPIGLEIEREKILSGGNLAIYLVPVAA